MPEIAIITKLIVLDSRSRVESGQCLPDSDGWILKLVDSETGMEQELFHGYYSHCLQLQRKWMSDKNLQPDIEILTAEAEILRQKNSSFIKRVSGRLRGRSG
ncbi:MAG: hypothetical protein Kow00107_06400 [Planctomycetota bacterium]